MENKDIILIILIIIVLYLLFCDNRKNKKIQKLEENFSATTSVTTSPVNEEIKSEIEKYLAERRDIPITESIKNLGIIARKLQDGGITIPGNITIPEGGKIILEGPGNKKSEIFFNSYADGLEIAQRNCGTLRLYQNGNGFDLDKDTIKKTHASNIKIEGNVELNGNLTMQDNKDIRWSKGGKIRADANGEMWINFDNEKKVTFGGDVNTDGSITAGSITAGSMGTNELRILNLRDNGNGKININTNLDIIEPNRIRFFHGGKKEADMYIHSNVNVASGKGLHLHIATYNENGNKIYTYNDNNKEYYAISY